MERNEWHERPNDWRSVGESARWNEVVMRFDALGAESATRAADEAHLASGRVAPREQLRAVAEAVIRDGLEVIAAAKMAYPPRGAPPPRPGLGKVTKKRARDVRGRIAKELAYAEHDLSGGRIYQAAHRVVKARAHLGRNGERHYPPSAPPAKETGAAVAPSPQAGDPAAVRSLLLDLARELANAENQAETIAVITRLDDHVAEIMKAAQG